MRGRSQKKKPGTERVLVGTRLLLRKYIPGKNVTHVSSRILLIIDLILHFYLIKIQLQQSHIRSNIVEKSTALNPLDTTIYF